MLTVTLSYAQFRAAYRYGTPRHQDYFNQAALDGKRRKVTMPVAGWKTLVDLLAEASFSTWGKRNRKELAVTESLAAPEALAKIAKAVAKLEAHPALRAEMVLGLSRETFLVWPAHHADGMLWQLTPDGSEAHVLEPTFEPRPTVATGAHHFVFRQGVTFWRPRLFGDAPIEHLGW